MQFSPCQKLLNKGICMIFVSKVILCGRELVPYLCSLLIIVLLQVSGGSPGPNQLAGRERLVGPDLGVVGGVGVVGGEEMVLTTAFDHHGIAPPHITMHPSV